MCKQIIVHLFSVHVYVPWPKNSLTIWGFLSTLVHKNQNVQTRVSMHVIAIESRYIFRNPSVARTRHTDQQVLPTGRFYETQLGQMLEDVLSTHLGHLFNYLGSGGVCSVNNEAIEIWMYENIYYHVESPDVLAFSLFICNLQEV
jgi:hypothetical protein